MEEYQSGVDVYSVEKVVERPTQPISPLEKIGNSGIIKEEFEPKLEYLTGDSKVASGVCQQLCRPPGSSPCNPPIPRPCTAC